MEYNTQELLLRLQTHDECQQIEAKACKAALGASVRETISAFSNEPDLGGGYLILGIKGNRDSNSDPRYAIAGVDHPDEIQCELASACRDEFNIQIRPEINTEVINGKSIVVVFIPEALQRDKPAFIKKLGVEKGAFRRIGPADHRCTARDLDLLYEARSGIPYESDVLPEVGLDDIDPTALSAYRRSRAQVDPGASELELDDVELLRSLRCLVKRDGVLAPNVAGLLLFGSKAALRRVFPADARVDYVITEGPEWIGNPSSRHYSIDYRESLVTLLPRLHAQIMGDLPKIFGLEAGKLQRTDSPTIPRDVIREALSNALMHRDYRSGQPTLIIRYSNRLEFKNAGYSLKPFDELGQPGSKQRNPIIAAVFHELKYAESKGTGIGSMKEWMRAAGLTTPPIVETSRDSNEFDLVLLPHHLLDQRNLEWLTQFSGINLSDAERRALVLTREMGAITNQDYRQVNGTDISTASRALVRLRDLELLNKKGAGSGTYYVLVEQRVMDPKEGVVEPATPHISPLSKGLTPYDNPLYKGLDAVPKEFPDLSEDLRQKIVGLPQRCSRQAIEEVIKKLCSLGPLKPSQLGRILGRDPQYLRINFLSKMVRGHELAYHYPDEPAHPRQAYVTLDEDTRGLALLLGESSDE